MLSKISGITNTASPMQIKDYPTMNTVHKYTVAGCAGFQIQNARPKLMVAHFIVEGIQWSTATIQIAYWNT